MIHRGTYDGTIYHNPVNKFCIISVKTADKEVPQEAPFHPPVQRSSDPLCCDGL